MGRLLRKKTVRKKKSEADASSGSDPGGAPAAGVPEPGRVSVRKISGVPAIPGIPGAGEKARVFLREVRAEYRKVTWPSRKQTLGSTIVVIVVVMIISAFLGIMDMGLSGLVRMVVQ